MGKISRVSYDIIVLALEGNMEALNFVITAFYPYIWGCVWNLCDDLSLQSKEDVAQLACMELMKLITSKKKFKI